MAWSPVLTMYLPSTTSSLIWPVSPGLIGPVDCVTSPLPPDPLTEVWNVTSCELLLWLVTMTTIGPAPNEFGETETRLAPTNAVTLIGDGGRGSFL
jgi:hypothetical protein